MRRARELAKEDSGAILIFALIIITTIALVTGALLTKAGGNFAATVKLREVASQAYASDTAAKIAINNLVWGGKSTVPSSIATYPNGVDGTQTSWVFDNNTDGAGCFGKVPTSGAALDRITIPGVYPSVGADSPAQSATVLCTPVLGTGLFGSGGGTVIVQPDASDPFARALTTVGAGNCTIQGTGTACSHGMTLKGLGSGTEIPMRGNIQSRSFINVSAGTLRTNGTIVAQSGCVGPTIPSCSSSGYTAPTPPPSPLVSVPQWVDLAAPEQGCNFSPGFYNSGAALSAAVNVCPTARFAPGKYYFDFADGKPWNIRTTVIGGAPVTNATTIPGRCVSPIDNPTTPGVQFVFGGSSYVEVEDTAHVELCGPANGGKAPLTIFQQQSGTTPDAQTVGPVSSSYVTTALDGKNDGVTTVPDTASLIKALSGIEAPNSSAIWKSSKKGNTARLDLQDFAGLDQIPVGATITSAMLNVTYASELSPGATFRAGVAGEAGTVNIGASGTNTDLTTLLNSRFQSSLSGFNSANPDVQLLIGNSAKGDQVTIDAVKLTVTYVPAGLRAATSPSTFITDVGGNFKGEFVVQGATYAPSGFISLTPGSDDNALVAFRWGIVAWGVNFKSLPSQIWGYPLVSIPDVSYGLGSAVTAVDLRIYLCAVSGLAPCPTGGPPALTSRVQFTDGTDSEGIIKPVAGQRKVEILSWAEQR